MDAAARRGSAAERRQMRTAFAHSAQYEVDFFAAPHAAGSARVDRSSVINHTRPEDRYRRATGPKCHKSRNKRAKVARSWFRGTCT